MKIAVGKGDALFTRDYVLLVVASFMSFAGFQLLLPVLPSYVLSIGGSESQVGLINGLFTITAVLARPFLGREVDRRGKKRVLLLGSLAITGLMASYNLAYTVLLLFVIRLFHGVAWGAANTAASAIVADLAPPSRRGEAMGYFGMASSVGMAVAPLAAVAIIATYGYHELFTLATGAVLIALVVQSGIREPRLAMAPACPAVNGPAPANSPWQGLIYRPALLPSIAILTMTLTYGTMVSFVPLQAYRSNVNPGLFFAVYAVFLIIARPIGGKVADLAGRHAATIPGMVLVALGIGLLAFATDLSHFLVAGAVYGAGFGFVHPSLLALTTDRAAPEARGAAMATFASAFDLGIGLGAILLGFLLEKTSFQVMYLTAAAIALASLIIYTVWSIKR